MSQIHQVCAPWLMRVDSRRESGKGHVVRSAILAKSLAQNAPVTMVLDTEIGNWRSSLEADRITVCVNGYQPPGPWRACVIDGYGFTANDISAFCDLNVPLIVIDDFLDPPRWATLVINSAVHLKGDFVNGTPALLGPRYALINPLFCQKKSAPITRNVNHIVVTFGTIDANKATCLSLDSLTMLLNFGIEFQTTVIVGSAMSGLSEIEKKVKGLGSYAELISDIENMIEIIDGADLVIGAGGVSLLERMANGTPSVSIGTSENQRRALEGASHLGGTKFAGMSNDLNSEKLAVIVSDLIDDYELRKTMSIKSRGIIDGGGADRVARAMEYAIG